MTLTFFVSCNEAQQFELLRASHSSGGIYNNTHIEPKQVVVNGDMMVNLSQSGRLDFFIRNSSTHEYESLVLAGPTAETQIRQFFGDEIVDATQVLNIFSNGKSLVALKRDNSIIVGGDKEGGGEAPVLGPFHQRIVSIEVVGTSYEIVFSDGKKFRWGEDFLPLNTNNQKNARTIVGRSNSNTMAHSILGFFDKDMTTELSDLRDVFFELKPNGVLDLRVWEPDDFYYYDLDESLVPNHLKAGGIRDIHFTSNTIVSIHYDGSIRASGSITIPSEISMRGNDVYDIYTSDYGDFALLYHNGEFSIFGSCSPIGSESYPGLRVVSINPTSNGFVIIFHNNEVATLATSCPT